MAINKTLQSIVFSGILALGAIGCNTPDRSVYEFNDKIGDEWVHFHSQNSFFGTKNNILTITSLDGKKRRYVDDVENDLVLEYVQIIENGKIQKYDFTLSFPDDLTKEVNIVAQSQFNYYLRLITETKTSNALEKLE